MVIRKFDDIRELLNERVEAMEDLNCEGLRDCVDAFITLSGLISLLQTINRVQSVVHCVEDDGGFEEFKREAVACVKIIDDLTLRDDAAE